MASTPLGEIAAAFTPVFEAADKPVEMAVFTRFDMEGRLHCEVAVFFSPAAEKIAQQFAAEPCARPRQDGLSLLAGDQRCWAALFPSRQVS